MKIDYLTAGCNNETGIFDELDGFIVYAGGKNVFVNKISAEPASIVTCALPQAPSGRVHACQWVKMSPNSLNILVASDDSFLRLYHCDTTVDTEAPLKYTAWSLKFSINLGSAVTLAAWIHCDPSNSSAYFVAATVKGEIFFIDQNGGHQLVCSYSPKKVTALTVGILPNSSDPFILAALSDSNIRLIIKTENSWKEELSLSGHQNWITSLSVSKEEESTVCVLSSSLDKSVRVWKIKEKEQDNSTDVPPQSIGLVELVPQRNTFFSQTNKKYSFMADSLALGHENAVFFARFFKNSSDGSLEILSGSSDRSLIYWNRGFGGAWRTVLQLGDLNGSLGTIGTDHTFAFYGGTIYRGEWIAAAASTGSILIWKRTGESDWIPQIPITGHTDRVESIAWAPESANSSITFLASTSKDQSTRIFAPTSDSQQHFREIARPQIHGYDLKCIALSSHVNKTSGINVIELISGADEKVLRIFQAPKQFYLKLGMPYDESVPDSAELPALGLSNKTVESAAQQQAQAQQNSSLPESEGDLVRNSLWPETDKLYGHNQEISSLALSSDRRYLATAAKSHLAADAALRIWTRESDDAKWTCSSVVPAHNLTVSCLAFSLDSKYLLSVSRDRNFCLISPQTGSILSKHEAHSRMIFTADWVSNDSFLTGSRDKTVKYWRINQAEQFPTTSAPLLVQSLTFENGVTALAVKDSSLLAVGDEFGNIFIYKLASNQLGWTPHEISISGGGGLGPADSITDLKWNNNRKEDGAQLAVASADNSIRIISFYL